MLKITGRVSIWDRALSDAEIARLFNKGGRMKRKTPYQRLQEEGVEYANKVDYPKTVPMWFYEKAFLPSLKERINAADQLGFDVLLRVEEDAIHVYYQEKRPPRPYDFKYRDWEGA